MQAVLINIYVFIIKLAINLGPTKRFKILYTNSFLGFIRMRCFAVKVSSATTHPKVIIVKYNSFLCRFDG